MWSSAQWVKHEGGKRKEYQSDRERDRVEWPQYWWWNGNMRWYNYTFKALYKHNRIEIIHRTLILISLTVFAMCSGVAWKTRTLPRYLVTWPSILTFTVVQAVLAVPPPGTKSCTIGRQVALVTMTTTWWRYKFERERRQSHTFSSF